MSPVGRPFVAAHTADLRATLERALARHCGSQQKVIRLERRPSAYQSSYALEELDVVLDDGSSQELMFKDLSRRAMLAGARRVKPAFLHDPRREIETYRRVLAVCELGTPTCLGSVIDPRRGRYCLFLERVPGRGLNQVGELAAWRQAARWLAQAHARFAELIAGSTGPWPAWDRTSYRRWLGRARAALASGPRLPTATQRTLTRLTAHYDRVIDRLRALPATLIHGDFYAANVLARKGRGGWRICPIDWEMAAIGPGLMDVAALSAGNWSEAENEI
jgi:hypothetical protein